MPWYPERRRQTIQQYATTGKIVGVVRANTSLNVTKYSHGDKMGYARYADLLFSTAKICMCIITAIAHATAVTHSTTYGSYTFCAINKYTRAMQRDLLEPCAGQLCAVKNGGSNPCRRQEKLGEMLLGQPSYLMAKAYGDKSMTVKRGFGRTCQTQCPARPARYGQGWIA